MRNVNRMLGLLLLAATQLPAAAAAVDAHAGRIFAVENCGRCHAVDRTGVSPLSKAPPFRQVARRYKLADLEEALAEGIVTSHPGMPEFELTPRQIDNLLAHMRRLRAQR